MLGVENNSCLGFFRSIEHMNPWAEVPLEKEMGITFDKGKSKPDLGKFWIFCFSCSLKIHRCLPAEFKEVDNTERFNRWQQRWSFGLRFLIASSGMKIDVLPLQIWGFFFISYRQAELFTLPWFSLQCSTVSDFILVSFIINWKTGLNKNRWLFYFQYREVVNVGLL